MLYASAIGRTSLGDEQVHTSQKDERVSIFTLVSAVFSKTPDEELLRLSYDVDDTPENIEQWVEGNVHFIPDDPSVAKAYRSLARADEYIGFTYRRQYHTLWRYATALMLLGVADAAGGRGIHARIMPPGRWQKMSTAKRQKAIRYGVLSRLASTMQLPQDTLREKYLETVSLLVEHDPGTYAQELMLDADGLNFFLNDRARAQEIIRGLAKKERDSEAEQKKKVKKAKPAEKADVPPAAEIPPVSVKEPEPPAPEPMPTPETEEENAPKKQPPTQSTLFDGF